MAGFGLAILMLKTKVAVMEKYEKSILELLGLEKKDKPTGRRKDFARRQQEWESKQSEEAEPETTTFEPEEAPEQFIHFKCRCGQRIKISSQYASRIGRCPKCSARLRIPEA